jgi:aminobenzoyl-glutamate utilization protein A
MVTADMEHLRSLRRDLHRHPEPGWREFYTTARLVEELETHELDELYAGPEVLGGERRLVPDDKELEAWQDRALEAGAREDVLDRLAGGDTGLVAVLRRGEGPTVGLRVDIDALPVREADGADHLPASEGFRSEHDGYMHACGHDAHAAVGVGVLDAVADSEFEGTLKLFFQPSEELVAGAEPMAAGGHLDDVDALLALHVGLGHPTGEVVAGVDDFLAVTHFRADFSGTPAHAGVNPEAGDDASLAMATAVQNLHAIPRHSGGGTRVNTGMVGGGTATNVVPEAAYVEGEVRGETTALLEHMEAHAEQVVRAAAEMHGCGVDWEVRGWAPSARSDDAVRDVVAEVAGGVAGVDSVVRSGTLGGSEDATVLMRHVQERGGTAAYVVVGTDHPGGHHTATFDVDEETVRIAVETLAGAVVELGRHGDEDAHADSHAGTDADASAD